MSVGRSAATVQSVETRGPDCETVATLDQVQAAAVRHAKAPR